MARGVGMDGAFQRVESIVMAFWILSDFVWMGTLLFAIKAMAAVVAKPNWVRRTPVIAATLAFLGALFLFPDDFAARALDAWLAPAGQLVLGFAIPFAALLGEYLKRRKEERGTPPS